MRASGLAVRARLKLGISALRAEMKLRATLRECGVALCGVERAHLGTPARGEMQGLRRRHKSRIGGNAGTPCAMLELSATRSHCTPPASRRDSDAMVLATSLSARPR